MNIEVEAKLKVDSLEPVARRLEALGAEHIGRVVQTDCYFDDASDSLKHADSALRIRCESAGERETNILSYKGPREPEKFKTRKELELAVPDADVAGRLLEALGYQKKLVFQKKRSLWRLAGCEVALDELPLLGFFVEIEGPGEVEIIQVQRRLNLDGLEHIPDSYALLMSRELSRRGKRRREVFF